MRNLKRDTAALLAGVLLFTLTACGSTTIPSGSMERSAAPSSSAEEPQMPTDAGITYELEERTQEESASADDGTVIAACHYELPELHVIGRDGSEITEAKSAAEKVALTVAATFNDQFSTYPDGMNFAEMTEWAREDYAGRVEDFRNMGLQYTSELSYTAWKTDHLVSICASGSSYTGGAHPNSLLMSWDYDLDLGAFLEPTIIAEDGQAFRDAVAAEIVRQADAKAAENGMEPTAFFWENYQEIAADWTSYAVSFNEQGMTIGFSAYEMACYAAGEQVFEVDYAFLAPYLSEYGQTLLGV